MVASEEAAAEATALGDVMQVALPQNGSRWVHVAGKLMLQNALLRFASSLPACVRFIARADDDALFNAGAIARLLLPSTAAAQSERIVFGPFKNVYAWHVESMMASCWDYGLSGSLRCINSFKATHANDTLVGPFHFAGGPFIAYSRPLAVELATLLRHSGTEAYVLSPARTERPLLHPWYGTYRGPEHPRHPSNTIFFEEVYLAYLAYRFMSHRDLVLLSALMRDAYWKITPGAVRNWTHQQTGPCPHVYHKLKRLELMERLANSSLLARAQSEAVVCDRNASIVDPGVGRKARLRWRWCALVPKQKMASDDFVRYEALYAERAVGW